MAILYQCPNCGKECGFSEDQINAGVRGLINCDFCHYPMRRKEEIKQVNHPELYAERKHHVIGTVPSTSKNQVACPYCKSTNCKKISGLSKAGSVALWGIFALGKTTKQWHCRSCGSDF